MADPHDLTTRAGQLRHVGAAVALTLELLDVSLVHLDPEARRDALSRGLVWALVQRYRGAELAAVVARLRTAADWLEAKGAELARPANDPSTRNREVA